MSNTLKTNINFLSTVNKEKDKNKKPSDKLGQRIFEWTTTTGKRIIMLTELIILIFFFSRFKLDQNLLKIKKDIALSGSILEYYQPQENKLKTAQKKIRKIKELKQTAFKWNNQLDLIQNKTPTKLTFETLSISANKIEMQATVDDAVSFGTFIQELVSEPKIKSITFTSSSYDVKKNIYEFAMILVIDNTNEQE